MQRANHVLIKTITVLSLFLMASSMVFLNANSSLASKNHISHYSFGEIIIDEKTYNEDLVLWPNKAPELWHADLHDMLKNDFDVIIESGIKTLIYGSGDEGAAYMTKKTIKHLKANGIEFKVLTTHEAVKFLNENDKSKLVAVLHLNC